MLPVKNKFDRDSNDVTGKGPVGKIGKTVRGSKQVKPKATDIVKLEINPHKGGKSYRMSSDGAMKV